MNTNLKTLCVSMSFLTISPLLIASSSAKKIEDKQAICETGTTIAKSVINGNSIIKDSIKLREEAQKVSIPSSFIQKAQSAFDQLKKMNPSDNENITSIMRKKFLLDNEELISSINKDIVRQLNEIIKGDSKLTLKSARLGVSFYRLGADSPEISFSVFLKKDVDSYLKARAISFETILLGDQRATSINEDIRRELNLLSYNLGTDLKKLGCDLSKVIEE